MTWTRPDEQRWIVAHLDGLQAKVNALPALRQSRRSLSGCTSGRSQPQTQEELPPSLYSGVLREMRCHRP